MDRKILVVSEENGRLDSYISKKTDMSRNFVQNLISENQITVNEKYVKSNYKVKLNDTISIIIPEPNLLNVEPENIDINIVYEDDDLAIVNKPQGMVVHPAAGNNKGTLVNALLYKLNNLSSINGTIRPGIVHRIDKNTSGLLMIAKNDKAHNCLAEQLKAHTVNRIYYALVQGVINEDKGIIDAPIGRSHSDRKKMTVTDKNSKKAVTNFEVIERFRNYTLVKLKLETGRTHQIRVHMKYIGHSVVGDDIYGKKKIEFELKGQLLHAKKIGFIHPSSEVYMEFDSDLPDYFNDVLKIVRSS